ncbi:DUF5803 family protein [Halovivax sp.]|uniref:DUF5803 family protein n=1 Tax=Halovivax sp. TaxID=1935978 RepID=UPI0025B9DF7A|nr:DUF5803 family protein [Halovivax sp.]
MNRRLFLAVAAVALLAGLAGCSMIFGGISDETLDREQEYDDLKDRNATVAIDVESAGIVSSGEFRAVYDLNGTEELELSQSTLYRDQAIDIHAVRYWYPNGTMVTGSELDVDQGRTSTDVRVPDGNGTLAFSGDSGRKSFTLPAFVAGSYDVTLPEGHRTSAFLLGEVRPSGYEREIVDDRERITWEEVDSTVNLQYYRTRDIPLFLGLVAVALSVGGAALAITYYKVKRLRRQREELGLEVDVEDDDRKPPPGFR